MWGQPPSAVHRGEAAGFRPREDVYPSSSHLYFETDILPGLAITQENPGCMRRRMECWRVFLGACLT
jgi:hypothetical protein